MPDTFGGTWNRPRNDGRGHSIGQVRTRAGFDNEPKNDCLSSLFLLSVLATALVASTRKGRTT